MIIDRSDFNDRPYRIDNQSEARDLDNWIEETERELLINLLGYELFAEFEAALDSSTLSTFFQELKDGATYTYSNRTYRYDGLVNLLKPAIYSLWLNPNTYKLTSVGYVENAPNTQNATKLDHEPFRVESWNKYVSLAGGGHDCVNYKNTFLGFMKANSAQYDNWYESYCKLPKFENRYSL